MRGLRLQWPSAGLLERNRAWQGIGSGRLASWHGFAHGAGAHDIRLHHDVSRSANHEQMLDIVAADQEQPASAINGGGIDHSESGLAPTRSRGSEIRGAETPCQPCE
jgi:hypothetical protein